MDFVDCTFLKYKMEYINWGLRLNSEELIKFREFEKFIEDLMERERKAEDKRQKENCFLKIKEAIERGNMAEAHRVFDDYFANVKANEIE